MPTLETPTSKASRRVVRPRVRWPKLGGFFRRLGVVLAGLILVPLVAIYLWLQWYGLPAQAKTMLLAEMERRGVSVTLGNLYLDVTGGVLADRVTVFRDAERQEVWVQVDRVRLGIAWISWWKGQPLLESARVSNAQLSLPLSPDTNIDLRQVNADVEVGPEGLDVRSVSARLLNFDIRMQGKVHLDGLPKPKPPSLEEQQARAKLWHQIESGLSEINTTQPILLQAVFDLKTSEPEAATIDLGIMCEAFAFRGMQFREASLNATLRQGLARLEGLRILPGRGQLTAYGQALIPEKNGEVQFESTADFSPLAVALDGKAADLLGQLTFRSLPRTTGRFRFDWGDGFTYDLQADVDWRAFRLGANDFERLRLAVGTDGKRIIVPEFSLLSERGALLAEFFLDQTDPENPVIKAKLDSDIDPTVFKGVFGEGLDKFLASVQIPGRGPKIVAEATSNGFKTEDWRIQGRLDADAFFYKRVGFTGAKADFRFEKSTLFLPDMLATREVGQASGGIEFNFKERWARLTELKTSVAVQEVAPVLGGRFPTYVEPYRFQEPPNLVVNGLVDLDDKKTDLETDLTVNIEAPGSMLWMLFGVDFNFVKPQALLSFKNRDMKVAMSRSGLLGGTMSGTLDMSLREKDPPYSTQFKLNNVDFKDFMKTCFQEESSSGRMSGSTSLKGRLNQLRTISGRGNVKIRDGYLLSIPFLGGLSAFLGEIIPDWGSARASEADSSFTVSRGKIRTKNLDIYSVNFTLIGEGDYDFVDDKLDLKVRANVRGLPGALLFPVSKLFEYHGTGGLGKTKWEPVNF